MKKNNPARSSPVWKGNSPDGDIYIIQNLLQPGDVLLTKSSHKDSSLIA